MNLINIFLKRFCFAYQKKRYSKYDPKYDIDLSFTEAVRRFPEHNDLYFYMNHYFYHKLPQDIVSHRYYIENTHKGFGEPALHAMWFLLFREYCPMMCFEIGVYRGQVISLWSLLSRKMQIVVDITGISPFTDLGDEVSTYSNKIDYKSDVLETFEELELPSVNLIKALSTDQVAKDFIKGRQWDCIYIDGCHDFEVALQDYRLCVENLSSNGILVLDDASLGTDFKPPAFSFAGHPGPSRVAREYADKELKFLGAVGHNNVYMK